MQHLKVRQKLQAYMLPRSFLGIHVRFSKRQKTSSKLHVCSVSPNFHFYIFWYGVCHNLSPSKATTILNSCHRQSAGVSAEPGQRKTNPRSEHLDKPLTILWRGGFGALHIPAPAGTHLLLSQTRFVRQLILKAGLIELKRRNVTWQVRALHNGWLDIRHFRLFSLEYTLDCYKLEVDFQSPRSGDYLYQRYQSSTKADSWGPPSVILQALEYFQHSFRRLRS